MQHVGVEVLEDSLIVDHLGIRVLGLLKIHIVETGVAEIVAEGSQEGREAV
jgi:hypothetical protein